MSLSEEGIICEKLKSQNNQELSEALILIRDNYANNEQKVAELQKYSVIQLIIPFLKSPTLHPVALNIIENFCVQKRYANDIIKEGGVKMLADILRGSKDMNIRISACRVLGSTVEYGTELSLSDIEKLLCCVNDYLNEISEVTGLKTALHTLGIFGKFATNQTSIEHKRSVFYCGTFLKCNDMDVQYSAIRCLYNLTKLNHSVGDMDFLSRRELIRNLVILGIYSTKRIQIYCLVSLINVSFDETIHYDMIETGAIKFFDYVLQNTNSQRIKQFVTSALCNFLHPSLLNSIKNEDIYRTLLYPLQTNGEIHVNVVSLLSPLKYTLKVNFNFLRHGILRQLIKLLIHFIERNGIIMFYNGVNFALEPFALSKILKESSLNEKQSAETICYQFDDNTFDQETDSVLNDIMTSVQWMKINVQLKSLDQEILRVIQELCDCCLDQVLSEIADEYVFSVLLDYLHFTDKPCVKAVNIILRVIKNRTQFKKLIQNGFLYKLEEKIIKTESIHHLNFSFLMQEFDIEAVKYKDNFYFDILKINCINSQFYVLCAASKYVRNVSVWNNIIYEANGVYLLINYLSSDNEAIRRRAVIALCQLYQFLKQEYQKEVTNGFLIDITRQRAQFNESQIKREKHIGDSKPNINFCIKSGAKCLYQLSDFDIIIITQSGKQIKANKEKLLEKSKYFKSILKQSYKESSSNFDYIKINKNTNNILFILHFIHGCQLTSACLDLKLTRFSQILDLLKICNEFCLSDLKSAIEDEIIYQLNASNLSDTFVASKICNAPKVSDKALKYALDLPLEDVYNMWNCFKALLNLERSFNLQNDIRKIIMDLVYKVNAIPKM